MARNVETNIFVLLITLIVSVENSFLNVQWLNEIFIYLYIILLM